MPPKKTATLKELVSALSDKIDAIATNHNERFNALDTSLNEIKKENSELKKKVTTLQEENIALKQKLQDVEQHSRSTNVRVFNYNIEGDRNNYDNLVDELYDSVFTPILVGQVNEGCIKNIPTRDHLITSTHLLPDREGKPKPIIVRLLNGVYRAIILQCQRKYANRLSAAHDPARPPPLLHPIFEDSTPEMYGFKQRLSGHDCVSAAWIAGGTVCYKLVGSESIKKVKSIFDPIEDILAS